ncbi:MAG TPA: hypothetical protein VEP28_00865, partial [Rubrobacter sp.]|nr:hypothetical protein [Rubrobacter sp.]
MAAASIALSVIGVVLIPVLTFPLGSNDVTAFLLPPWGPAASIAFTGVVFAAAIVLAVLSKAEAGRPVFHALLWAILGLAVGLVLLWGAFILKGFGERFDPTSLYSQELVDSPATIEHPLPFGTQVVLRTLDTREPVMIVTAEQPLMVTQEAVDYGLPIPDGDYVAVSLTIEVVDPTAAGRGMTLPTRQWVTPIGAGGYLLESQEETMLPGYPRADLLDLTKTGVHRVYDLIDTSAFGSGEGAYQWSVLGPG